MPGHLHRRLLSTKKLYVSLLAEQGAQFFFPLDDAMSHEPTTGSVNESVGLLDTSLSALYWGLKGFSTEQPAICSASKKSIRVDYEGTPEDRENLRLYGANSADGARDGGSCSFWFLVSGPSPASTNTFFDVTDIIQTMDAVHLTSAGTAVRWLSSAYDSSLDAVDGALPAWGAATHVGLVAWDDGAGGTDLELYLNGVLAGTGNEPGRNSFLYNGRGEMADTFARFSAKSPPTSDYNYRFQAYGGVFNTRWGADEFLAQYNLGKP